MKTKLLCPQISRNNLSVELTPPNWFTLMSALLCGLFAGSISAQADITYVDAVEGPGGNTFATGSTQDDASWVIPDQTATNNTNWVKRTSVEGNENTLFQALPNGSAADIPELTTRLSGLADGTYDIWVFYWDQVTSDTQNWTIATGLTSGSLTTYSSPGEPEVTDAITDNVFNAADLTFTNSVDLVAGETAPGSGIFNRALFGVNVGQVTATGGSDIHVYVDMLINGAGSTSRTWYDGVGYAPATSAPVSALAITSFTAVGGGVWEVALEGEPSTAYEFRSSVALDFNPGTLVENLAEGAAGTVGGLNDSVVTTDGSGNATVQMNLGTEAANFIRAQTTP